MWGMYRLFSTLGSSPSDPCEPGIEGSTGGAELVRNLFEIQDIDEARRQEGIDDVELRQAIRGLAVGDDVKLTVVTGPRSSETVDVRITRIRGSQFRGKLINRLISNGPVRLAGGSIVVFSAAHIHSYRKHRNMPTTSVSKKPTSPVPVGLPISPTLPWTHEERLQRIEAMGERIAGYVRFMCQVGNLAGASDEAKTKAVAAFYEKMVTVERQLGQIHDGFRLE